MLEQQFEKLVAEVESAEGVTEVIYQLSHSAHYKEYMCTIEVFKLTSDEHEIHMIESVVDTDLDRLVNEFHKTFVHRGVLK